MKILAVIDPCRVDLYNYLKYDSSNTYVLLWFETENEAKAINSGRPGFFKEEYYWSQFRTPEKLIKTIKPDKILFQQIIDQRQIALLVYANARSIISFYLDHGAAGNKETAAARSTEKDYNFKSRFFYFLKKALGSFHSIVKVKYYYYSNFNKLNSLRSTIDYLTLPFSTLKHQPTKALSMRIFKERVPKYSIIFSKSNLEEYRLYTGVNNANVILTGVPSFDHFYKREVQNADHIVYIEHPMLEENLLNWNAEHHRMLANLIFHFANKRKIKMFVKLHPRSDLKLWRSYNLNSPYFEILQEGDFTDLYLSSRLILGYSSSLLTGCICAKKNVVNVGWHPEPQIFGVDFSKSGLCHKSYSAKDLEEKFDHWTANNLCIKNASEYDTFISYFNYPFDGKATERILKAIANV